MWLWRPQDLDAPYRHPHLTPLDEDDVVLPTHEFIEPMKGYTFGETRGNWKRDGFSIWSGIKSLYQHLTYSEFIFINIAALGMTFFYCYYLYPAQPQAYHLAARVKFNLIATAVLFPSTMLATETLYRRENALRRLASFRSTLCHILRAFLIWRHPSIHMSREWELKAKETLVKSAHVLATVLTMPTVRDRHDYTKGGRLFAKEVNKRKQKLVNEMIVSNLEIHILVQDMIQAGMSHMESIRLMAYIMQFSLDFDYMLCLKTYRTTRSGRVFVRIILTSCLMFYGPYYSYVAGLVLSPDSGGQVNVAFSAVLTVASTLLLLGIVAIHRSTEDPFLWHYPGDAIDVKLECNALVQELNSVYEDTLKRHEVQDTAAKGS